MALTSIFFRDDPQLQACLVNDPSHVPPGSVGAHVLKLQQAVILLDDAKVEARETRLQQYGTSTSAAVLAYKTKREIINRGYQQSPDNIVGKMTIARLDAEMASFEPNNQPLTSPNEKARIQTLLDRERFGAGQMIEATLTALVDVAPALAGNQSGNPTTRFTLDGLKRFFSVTSANAADLATVIGKFQAYKAKLPNLRVDQKPADYPALLRNDPDFLKQGRFTATTPPAFSAAPRGMFFTPRYRAVDPRQPALFAGLATEALRGIQVHEMGHFYFGFDDGDPRGQPTSRCLRLASAYDLLARQITFQRLVATN
jgi:hypothetical protein